MKQILSPIQFEALKKEIAARETVRDILNHKNKEEIILRLVSDLRGMYSNMMEMMNAFDKVRHGKDGKDGKDGKNGKDGKDGHTPTVAELTQLITPLIPELQDGHTPTQSEILELVYPLIPEVKHGHTPTKDELLALIKPLIPEVKADDLLNIFNTLPKGKRLKSDFIDGLEQTMTSHFHQLARGYLHGAGDTVKAGSNITLTKNNDGTTTIISTGGGFTKLTTASTIDDSNVSFVFSDVPTYLVINGVWYDNTVGDPYTWSVVGTTVTLNNAAGAGGRIWGFK